MKSSQLKTKITFLSFNPKHLDIFLSKIKNKFKRSLIILNIPQKIHKFALIKSPFIYKKSQEVFQIKKYKTILYFTTQFKKIWIYPFFRFLIKNLPPGIDFKINTKIGI